MPKHGAPSNFSTTVSRDSGLVKIRISWLPASDIIASKISIRDLSDPNVELRDSWRVLTTDSSLVITETFSHLLRGGEARLAVTATNKAGDSTTDTAVVQVPFGELIKTLSTGGQATFANHAVDIQTCGDGFGYMPAGASMVIFDPNRLDIVAIVNNPEAFQSFDNVACPVSDETLFVTDPLTPFNTQSRTWDRFISDAFASNALANSKSNPNIIYVGEQDGGVAAFDRAARRRLARVSPPSSSNNDFVFSIAVMANDSKIYATRALEGGIVVISPTSASIIKRISLGDNRNFRTDCLALSKDGLTLYAAVTQPGLEGVAVISTASDKVIRLIPVIDGVPQAIALSPSNDRLFVTTQDANGVPSHNLLIEASTGNVISRFDRPRNGGRWDAHVTTSAEHPLFFVARNMDIDVYLNRE